MFTQQITQAGERRELCGWRGGRPVREARGDSTRSLFRHLTENEINSAMLFVAAARDAYRAAKFSEGSAALSKAEAIYLQASGLAASAGAQHSSGLLTRLQELRLAIDCLMAGNVD